MARFKSWIGSASAFRSVTGTWPLTSARSRRESRSRSAHDTPQPVEGPPADALKQQAQFDGLLLSAHHRGDAIEVVGSEIVEGTPTWKLAIKGADRVTHVFLDQKTGLERKVSATIAGDAGEVLVESVISDYEPVNGLLVPRKVETRVGGQQQATVRIETVEFNVPIDDSRFQMQR